MNVGDDKRPRPAMSSDTAFFWEGCRQHRLLAQCCTDCGTWRHPPGPACPACHSLDWEARPFALRGTVLTWSVHHHPPLQDFVTPHTVVLAQMEHGLRLVAPMQSYAAGELRDGLAVEVVFEDQGSWTLPWFRPARPGDQPAVP